MTKINSGELQRTKFDTDELIRPRDPVWFSFAKRKINLIINQYFGSAFILDVGGYDGKITTSFNSVVLDISLTGLLEARKTGLKAVLGDFNSMPLKEETFGGAVLCSVIEHTPQPLNLIHDVLNLVNTKGYLLIVVPNAKGLNQIKNLLFFGDPSPAGNSPDDIPQHYHQYTKINLLNLLMSNKFKVLYIGGDSVELPFFRRFKQYRILFFLGKIFPSLCNNLIFLIQKEE